MLEEEVNLTIEPFERPVPENWQESPAYHMRALVEAVFTMQNLGETDESFDVWFPLSASVRYPGLLAYMPDNVVQDFQVWVDGMPIATEQVQAPDLSDPTQESAWARFPMSFPAGQQVVVRVNYTLYPSGRRPFGGFEYILQTGAGWKDTIGKAVINVYLPDTVTAENVSLSGNSIEGLPIAPQPAGYSIENNVIRWELTDLEPTEQDNIFVDVLEPTRYRELVQARSLADDHPDSADAQLALAEASKNALMIVKTVGQHGGGAALAEQANAAYRRALELAPQRAETYVDFSQWLMSSGGMILLMRDATCLPELCDLVERGLKLFPENTELNDLDEMIHNLQSEAAPYATQAALDQSATAESASQQATRQALSATASAAAQQPTAAPATPTPATSLAPAVTATPTALAQDQPGIAQGTWLLLVLLAVIVLFIWLRGRAARG
jgi:hypothetical protein